MPPRETLIGVAVDKAKFVPWRALPVVVELPLIVRPPVPVPLPMVEEAYAVRPLLKLCNAVQVFATVREAPVLAPTHVPLIEKQPPVRLIPPVE